MILPGNASTGATKSASPASMALLGMLSNLAEAGSCTKVTPPFSLMARRPSVPSEPIPDRMTPMLRSCWSSARERKKKSIGRRRPCGAMRSSRCRHPVEDGHVFVRRDHIDAVRLNRGAILDLKDLHGGGALEQFRHELLCVGSRCWTMTKAMPLVCRNVPQEQVQASSPPAEAPMPTMGTRGSAPRASSVGGERFSSHGAPSFFSHSRGWWRLRHGRTYLYHAKVTVIRRTIIIRISVLESNGRFDNLTKAPC